MTSERLMRKMVVGVALVAVLVPVAPASGAGGPRDAVDRHQVPVRWSDAVDRQPAATPTGVQRSYDGIELVRPSQRDLLVRVPGTASGFDWGDAGIGAGATLAALLVLGAAAMAVTAHGRRVTIS